MAAEKPFPAPLVSGFEIECCHCFCGSEQECRTVSTRTESIGRNGTHELVSHSPAKKATIETLAAEYVDSGSAGRRDLIATLAFAAEHNVESLVDVLPFTDVNRAIDIVRRGNTVARTVLER